MKKEILLAIFSIAVITTGLCLKPTQDEYARERVVLLKSSKGTCSGVEVRGAKTNKIYTLTAKHCAGLLVDGKMTAVTEDGKDHTVSLVAVSETADILILSGVGNNSVIIANSYTSHGKVHTMTHGGGHASYRTDGELLEQRDLPMRVGGPILSDKDLADCLAIKGKPQPVLIFNICVVNTRVMMTTAQVIPGSSGGPLLDENNKLVGIVSIRDNEGFSGTVTLGDIHAFLADK